MLSFYEKLVPPAELVSPRNILFRYIAAIMLIFCTMSAEFYFSRQTFSLGDELASAINVSGRQRMLSQRIQLYSLRYANSGYTDQNHLEQLTSAVNLFEESHASLIDIVESKGESAITLRDHYLAPDQAQLDRQVSLFVKVVRVITQTSGPGASNPIGLLDNFNSEQLLVDLNTAVGLFEALSNRSLEAAKRNANNSYRATTILLALEFLFIFIPAHLAVVGLKRAWREEKRKKSRT